MNFAAVNGRRVSRYYITLSATIGSRCALPLDLRSTRPSRTMATKTAICSEGEDGAELQRKVEPLLVDGGGQWTLSQSRKGLERQIRFKTFKKTWVCPPCRNRESHLWFYYNVVRRASGTLTRLYAGVHGCCGKQECKGETSS